MADQTIEDLGKLVKQRYPEKAEYQKLSDTDLGRAVRNRYPNQYKQFKDPYEKETTPPVKPPDPGFFSILGSDLMSVGKQALPFTQGPFGIAYGMYQQAKRAPEMVRSQYETGKKAFDPDRTPTERAGYGAAALMPGYGPLAAQAGEELGGGSYDPSHGAAYNVLGNLRGQGGAHALEAIAPFTLSSIPGAARGAAREYRNTPAEPFSLRHISPRNLTWAGAGATAGGILGKKFGGTPGEVGGAIMGAGVGSYVPKIFALARGAAKGAGWPWQKGNLDINFPPKGGETPKPTKTSIPVLDELIKRGDPTMPPERYLSILQREHGMTPEQANIYLRRAMKGEQQTGIFDVKEHPEQTLKKMYARNKIDREALVDRLKTGHEYDDLHARELVDQWDAEIEADNAESAEAARETQEDVKKKVDTSKVETKASPPKQEIIQPPVAQPNIPAPPVDESLAGPVSPPQAAQAPQTPGPVAAPQAQAPSEAGPVQAPKTPEEIQAIKEELARMMQPQSETPSQAVPEQTELTAGQKIHLSNHLAKHYDPSTIAGEPGMLKHLSDTLKFPVSKEDFDSALSHAKEIQEAKNNQEFSRITGGDLDKYLGLFTVQMRRSIIRKLKTAREAGDSRKALEIIRGTVGKEKKPD